MAFLNNLRHINVILYRLLRSVGLPIVIRDGGSPSLNKQTGIQTKSFNSYTVQRALVLQGKELRDFVYDLSFIAANKNFTYGAFYDTTKRVFIIRRKDIPSGLTITLDFSVVFENEWYAVKQLTRIKGNLGYILACQSVSSTPAVS